MDTANPRVKVDQGAIIKIDRERYVLSTIDLHMFNLINMRTGHRWTEAIEGRYDELYLDMFKGDGNYADRMELLILGKDR